MQSSALIFQRTFCVGFLSLAVLNFAPLSHAVTVESVPNPRQVNNGWVTDMANILSPTTEAEINRKISELEAKNGSEIAVVTVSDTSPSATPKVFATKLFNRWGIGKKGRDNGVLFLISKGDRRVEIETGYGVEPILPNAKVGNIIQQQITPRFKQGDFDGGTLAGTKALVVALQGDATVSPPVPISAPPANISVVEPPSPEADVPWLPLAGLAGGVVLAVIAYKRCRSPVFVEPEGRSRTATWLRRPLHCDRCKQPMRKLDSALAHLSPTERVAQKIGSLEFEAWECPQCCSQLTGSGIHIRSYILNSHGFKTCPHCQELTVERTRKILRHPTQFSEGRSLVTDDCHCCSYHKETEESIPRLPPPPPPPPPSSPSPPSSGGGGYSSSGSSSGGDGSFGGGSSGGGGAGGSW